MWRLRSCLQVEPVQGFPNFFHADPILVGREPFRDPGDPQLSFHLAIILVSFQEKNTLTKLAKKFAFTRLCAHGHGGNTFIY